MTHVLTLIGNVCKSVLLYAATNLRHNLRGRILRTHMVPSTAVTMQTTLAAMTVQSSLNLDKYQSKPDVCTHPSGFRTYGAAGHSIKICDLCGFRALLKDGQMQPIQPKASPHAKTPLGVSKAKGKAKSKSISGTSGRSSSGWEQSLPSYPDYSWEPPRSQNSALNQEMFRRQVEEQVQRRLIAMGKAPPPRRADWDNRSDHSRTWWTEQEGVSDLSRTWWTEQEEVPEAPEEFNWEARSAHSEGLEQNLEEMETGD